MASREEFWSKPQPLGHATSTTSFASIASPLLAGFSIAAVVALVGRADRGLRGDLAIAFFSMAIAFLVFAIQSGSAAASRHVSVAERVALYPEKVRNPETIHQIRSEQWRDEAIASHHRLLTRLAYNTGIVAFLAGLLCVALPGPGDWNVPRVVAVFIVGLAIVVEIIQQAHRPRRLAAFLAPSDEDLELGYTPFPRREVPPLSSEVVAQTLGAGQCTSGCPHCPCRSGAPDTGA